MNCYRFPGFLSLKVFMHCSVLTGSFSVTCHVPSFLIHYAVSSHTVWNFVCGPG